MSHEGYFNIVNASYNYLFTAEDDKDGKDHIAETRPGVSTPPKPLDEKKYWWKLEAISGEKDDNKQCYYIRNEEYGYLFAADGNKDGDDHRVECRPNPSEKDLKLPKFKWTISKRDRLLDWCNVNNLAYGRMFAAKNDLKDDDHVVQCRPSGDHDEVKFRWFFLDRLQLDSWMQHIGDHLSLSALSIPGTHDSGTESLPSGTGRTQLLTMDQQLWMGTRFIDCRLEIQIGTNGKLIEPFRLCFAHGEAQIATIQFKDFVKNTLIAFLNAHENECVILSIHDESSRTDDWEWQKFAELVSDTIHDSTTSSYWYTKNKIPRLEDVRKKIVLIRRYKTSDQLNTGTSATKYGSIGINARSGWPPNRSSSIHNDSVDQTGGIDLEVQDLYEIKNTDDILNKKWPAIKTLMDTAGETYLSDPVKQTLYLNFLNAVANFSLTTLERLPTPWDVAWHINPQVLSYLEEEAHRRGRRGVLPADYAAANLNAAIIASNFR